MNRWQLSDMMVVGSVLAVAAALILAAGCFGLSALVLLRTGRISSAARQGPVEQPVAIQASPSPLPTLPSPTVPVTSTAASATSVLLPSDTPLPPTWTPTLTPTWLPSMTPTPIPSASPRYVTATPTEYATWTPTPPGPTEEPSATHTPSATPTSNGTPGTGTPTATSGTPTVTPTPTSSSTSTPTPTPTLMAGGLTINILEVNRTAEYFVIQNISPDAVSVAGWRIGAEGGTATCQLQGTLDPGSTARYWSFSPPPLGDETCGLSGELWPDGGGTAVLKDAQGREMDSEPF